MRGWTRAILHCLAVVACLAQLMAAPHQHTLRFAERSAFTTAHLDAASASFRADQLALRCVHPGAQVGHPADNEPAPCDRGNCPDCLCCAQVHVAIGILPQDAVPAAYAPLLVTIEAPPAHLGSDARFTAICGQPRAPPFLI
ncbi:MAG TPA: hypothetical protein VLZ74_06745 [Methylocella sp.]|nr:hypothetical protein [Methylocella sp.]